MKTNSERTLNEGFWDRVDELRGRTSVRELCERTGINEGSFQSTRVVKTMPKVPWLYALAKYFGTTMEYLYTGEREDWEDSIVFRKMASNQDLIDICTALMYADGTEIKMVKRLLLVGNSVGGGRLNAYKLTA